MANKNPKQPCVILLIDSTCPESSNTIQQAERAKVDGVFWRDSEIYPLVNVYKKLWKDPPFCSWENYGNLTISMAIFNSYVKFPEGM